MLINKLSKEGVRRLYNNPNIIVNTVRTKNGINNCNYMTKRNLSFTKLHFTHYLEDYYTCPEIATNMISPVSEYIWWSWAALQAVIVFGTLLHSNYYFTGKPLPKVQGNSQLCEDSW
ncbi:conserved protein, unknown function [Hepatocystis sp. ex Piliocolobus tephrosceles]|nr:conserved protein, unknown function [Hepatocystis sp. ex Piliocolobus tephrosceles]